MTTKPCIACGSCDTTNGANYLVPVALGDICDVCLRDATMTLAEWLRSKGMAFNKGDAA